LATKPLGSAGRDYIKYWATILPLTVIRGSGQESGVVGGRPGVVVVVGGEGVGVGVGSTAGVGWSWLSGVGEDARGVGDGVGLWWWSGVKQGCGGCVQG
jgi:hypothetical protein